jgi:hypothetical protein
MRFTKTLPIAATAVLALSGAAVAHDRHHEASSDDATAGKVTSFENGVLTLTLNDGSTLKGAVTRGTKVKCEGADEHATARSARHGDDDGPGHDRGDDRGHHANHNADEHATGCTIANGDTVREAELKVRAQGARFKEVELAK